MLGHKYDIPGLVEYASPVATCRLLELDMETQGMMVVVIHGSYMEVLDYIAWGQSHFFSILISLRFASGPSLEWEIKFQRTRKSSTVKALILHDPYSFSKKETSLQFSSKSWGDRPMVAQSMSVPWGIGQHHTGQLCRSGENPACLEPRHISSSGRW